MQETLGQCLCRENPLEKEVATHSSILAWRIQCTEGPGGLQSMGSQRVGHDLATKTTITKKEKWLMKLNCCMILKSYKYCNANCK